MDTVSNLTLINWQNHFLFREPGLIFNLGTFYPHSLSTYLVPPMFGTAQVFGLFALFGLNLYAQYNLFIVLALLVGAAGVFSLALEASGADRIGAFAAAAIYIVFNTHRSLFTWLPLFVTCLVPWTLLFFFRYLRLRRLRDLGPFLAFAAAQFILSAYLGVYLLVFFLPWLVLFALLFKELPWKNLLWIAAGLVLVGALILALQFPVISSFPNVTSPRGYHPGQLLNISDLFTANRSFLYGQVLNMHRKALYNWFPGILVYALFFVSGLAKDRPGRWRWLALMAAGVAGVLLLKDLPAPWGSILFFALLAFFAGSHVRRRRQHLPLTLLALAFTGYILVFFNMRPLGLPGPVHPFSLLAAAIPYFQRMCEYKRVFTILVPVMAVLAAHTLSMLPRRRRWLPLLALGVIWMENFEPAIRDWGRVLPWSQRASIYASIPRESDKVILELPFFGETDIWSLPSFFQSIYGYSTRFHWNFVVNGRASFAPLGHRELARHAAIPGVFTPENIEWLKRHHSVEYLVVNWPYLKGEKAALARERLPFLAAVGDKVLDIPEAAVFRLREREEVTRLQRTYSAYHLRHRQLHVRFAVPCSLQARVAVGDRFWREFSLQDETSLRFRVDPRRVGPDCEMLTISFSRPARVEEIALCK